MVRKIGFYLYIFTNLPIPPPVWTGADEDVPGDGSDRPVNPGARTDGGTRPVCPAVACKLPPEKRTGPRARTGTSTTPTRTPESRPRRTLQADRGTEDPPGPNVRRAPPPQETPDLLNGESGVVDRRTSGDWGFPVCGSKSFPGSRPPSTAPP